MTEVTKVTFSELLKIVQEIVKKNPTPSRKRERETNYGFHLEADEITTLAVWNFLIRENYATTLGNSVLIAQGFVYSKEYTNLARRANISEEVAKQILRKLIKSKN
jgi:hypothetical protein